jgi:hypothetical protein
VIAGLGVAVASACAYAKAPPPSAPHGAAHTSVSAKRSAPPTPIAEAEGHAAAPDAPVADPPNEAFREPVGDKLDRASPAVRFGDMASVDCLRRIEKEGIALTREEKAEAGVTTPVRITGPLHGVKFVVPPSSSAFGVLDCRLGLALDELAGSLSRFDVTVVRVDNFYRPHAKLPGKEKASQHAFGLAADITTLQLSSGRVLTPADDWAAEIGDTPCGPKAVMEPLDGDGKGPTIVDATLLRNIVCDVARKGLFHDVLTPSFNAAHRTHFHFDIKHDTSRQALR